jgi:hypothetical protein
MAPKVGTYMISYSPRLSVASSSRVQAYQPATEAVADDTTPWKGNSLLAEELDALAAL